MLLTGALAFYAYAFYAGWDAPPVPATIAEVTAPTGSDSPERLEVSSSEETTNASRLAQAEARSAQLANEVSDLRRQLAGSQSSLHPGSSSWTDLTREAASGQALAANAEAG